MAMGFTGLITLYIAPPQSQWPDGTLECTAEVTAEESASLKVLL